MAGNFGDPYRPPCNGWGAARFYYEPPQHFVPAHKKIPVRRNITQVPNPLWDDCRATDPSPETGLTTNPYLRAACDTPPGPYAQGCLDNAPCGPWPRPHPMNVYLPPSDTEFVDRSVCRKIGFKNCYAYKNWHGMYPFNSRNIVPWITALYAGGCQQTEGVNLTPESIKYLRYEYSASGTYRLQWWDPPDGPLEGVISNSDGHINSVDEVDRLSGRHSGNLDKVFNDGLDPNDGTTPLTDMQSLINDFITAQPIDDVGDLIRIYTAAIHDYIDLPDATFSWGAQPQMIFDDGSNRRVAELDLDAGTVSVADSSYAVVSEVTLTAQITATVASVNYVSHIDYSSTSHFVDYHYNITRQLSLPYTAAQLSADVDELLDQWRFNDDATYPWRTDGLITRGPLVTRNERSTQSLGIWPELVEDPDNPGTFHQWTDDSLPPRDDVADGGIAGGPLPVGSEAYFDFSFIGYDDGNAVTYGTVYLPETYGGYAPSYCPHATQWLNKYQSKYMPYGPFIALGAESFGLGLQDLENLSGGFPIYLNQGVLWKCKWAEIIIPRVSMNCFRPCGPDSTAIALSSQDCISNPDGDLLFPAAYKICGRIAVDAATQNGGNVDIVIHNPATYLVTGDLVDLTGVGGLSSGLTVTVTDPTHFSVPGTLSGAYTTGGFVQSAGSPGYYWHDDGKKMDFVFKEWKHDFRDFWESYAVHGRYVDRVAFNDGNDPEVSGTPDCPDLPDADPVRYIPQTPPNPDYPGNTIGTGTKWLKEMNTTQLCLPKGGCLPSVCCVSPNTNDGFTGDYATTVLMPDAAEVIPDSQYGTLWLGRVEQWRDDPLWVPPAIVGVCDNCDFVSEDDGTGHEDFADLFDSRFCFFAQRPFVEARTTLPDIGAEHAPDPEGFEPGLTCDNFISNLNEDPPVAANTWCQSSYFYSLNFEEPSNGYFFYADHLPTVFTPWITQIAQELTVTTGGRFASDYRANGVNPDCRTI